MDRITKLERANKFGVDRRSDGQIVIRNTGELLVKGLTRNDAINLAAWILTIVDVGDPEPEQEKFRAMQDLERLWVDIGANATERDVKGPQ